MTAFDLIVFGGGTGNTVASAAAEAGMETALVERGPIGGLCLNRGCNPSKMLIQRASTLHRVRDADEFGIDATVEGVQFGEIVRGVNDELAGLADNKERNKRQQENLTLFQQEARFLGDKEIELVDTNETHTAERVVVAAGSTPVIPGAIDGLDEVEYLTSTDAIRLETPPDRLVVLGGGYIAAELGYYFDAFGTEVALIEMEDSLVPREDQEVATAFTDLASDRHDVYTSYQATEVTESSGEITVTAEAEDGDMVGVAGDELLVALGRQPNTDGIALNDTTIETNDAGFIETDSRLRTSVEGIWAMGDIADNSMFKHSGDYEGEIVIDNVVHDADREGDFSVIPHAVFTEPQVGAVGKTEEELDAENTKYVVGRAAFTDTAMSRALKLDTGFAKVLCDPDTHQILGCHIFGHEASMLVHEVVPAVRYGLTADDLANTLLHAHPALSKVVKMACADAVDAS